MFSGFSPHRLPQQVDILTQLRAASQSSYLSPEQSLFARAADVIESLRAEVTRLKDLKSPETQHAAGYAQAQADIRRALGVDD